MNKSAVITKTRWYQ